MQLHAARPAFIAHQKFNRVDARLQIQIEIETARPITASCSRDMFQRNRLTVQRQGEDFFIRDNAPAGGRRQPGMTGFYSHAQTGRIGLGVKLPRQTHRAQSTAIVRGLCAQSRLGEPKRQQKISHSQHKEERESLHRQSFRSSTSRSIR